MCACCAADQVKDRPQPEVTESIDTNILDFCSIDSQGRRLLSPKSLGEKEQDYLQALSVRHLSVVNSNLAASRASASKCCQ